MESHQSFTEDPADDTDQMDIQATVSSILEETLVDQEGSVEKSTGTECEGVADPAGANDEHNISDTLEAPKLDEYSEVNNDQSQVNEARSPPKLALENGFVHSKSLDVPESCKGNNGTSERMPPTTPPMQTPPKKQPQQTSPKKRSQSPCKVDQDLNLLATHSEKKEESSHFSPLESENGAERMSDSEVENGEKNSDAEKMFNKVMWANKKPIRLPKEHGDKSQVSLFLPKDWEFLAVKRQVGSSLGQFDIYYFTPPKPYRRKLRSRQELLTFMKNHNLDYDPLLFFRRKDIPILVKKGIIKYYNSKYLVRASCEESDVLSFLKFTRESKQDNQIMKKTDEALRKKEHDQRRKERVQKRKEHVQRTIEHVENISQPPVVPQVSRRGRPPSNKNLQAQQARKQAQRQVQRQAQKQAQKQALHSPKKPVGRPSFSKRARLASPMPKEKVSKSSPIKPRGGRRTRSSALISPEAIKSEVEASPPRSDIILEERVRILPKPKIFKSPYFTSSMTCSGPPKSPAGIRRERNSPDAPPRSPYNLIQEDLFHDPWQLLIATIFLNSTSGKVAIPLALEFLKRWPTPQAACQAQLYDILDVIEPLGFGRTRAAIIIRFSYEFLTKDWKLPNDLYGIGKYGTDSYKIFCMKNEWKRVESDDPMLMMYLNWRRATEHLRKQFLAVASDPTSVDPDDIACTSKTVTANNAAKSSPPSTHSKRKSFKPVSSSVESSQKKRLRTKTIS